MGIKKTRAEWTTKELLLQAQLVCRRHGQRWPEAMGSKSRKELFNALLVDTGELAMSGYRARELYHTSIQPIMEMNEKAVLAYVQRVAANKTGKPRKSANVVKAKRKPVEGPKRRRVMVGGRPLRNAEVFVLRNLGINILRATEDEMLAALEDHADLVSARLSNSRRANKVWKAKARPSSRRG